MSDSVSIKFIPGVDASATVSEARAVFAQGGGMYETLRDADPPPKVFILVAAMSLFLGIPASTDKHTQELYLKFGYKSQSGKSSPTTWIAMVDAGLYGKSQGQFKDPEFGSRYQAEFQSFIEKIDQNADTMTLADVYREIEASPLWDRTFSFKHSTKKKGTEKTFKWDLACARKSILAYAEDPASIRYYDPTTGEESKSEAGEGDGDGGSEDGSGEKDTDVVSLINAAIDDGALQIVLTGAPGTGKTFSALEYVQKKPHEFVQFHSSYDYTDFVEGLRPIPAAGGGNRFVRTDGVFKSFCRRVVEENLKKSGKPYDPTAREREGEMAQGWTGDTLYYFVIDEINRADLGRVFGELMFGLEEDYRGRRFNTQYQNLPITYCRQEDGTLREIPPEQDVFAKGFFIPGNLVIIGTMNDIDRSVETFDFALRRRFLWIDVKANAVMLKTLESILKKKKSTVQLSESDVKQIKDFNEIISSNFGLTEAYHLGPTYFSSFYDDAEKTWQQKIEPILREYTRGRDKTEVDKFLKACREQLLSQ